MTAPGDDTPRTPTSADLKWESLAGGLEFLQLAEIRQTAEKWRNGLTALTALIGVVFTVGGTQLQDSNVDRCWRFAIALLQFSALGALAYGSWRCMQAAFGIPTVIRNNGVRLQEWTAQATRDAADQLACARRATIIGFVLLALAVAAIVVAPLPPSDRWIVDVRDGRSFCGTLDYVDHDAVVTGADGTRHKIALSATRGVERVDHC